MNEIRRTEISSIKGIIEHLRDSFNSQRTLDIEWRLQQLSALKDMLADHLSDFEEALYLDLHRGRFLKKAEVTHNIHVVDEAIKNVGKWVQPEEREMPLYAKPGRCYVMPQPLGVVLVIGPWNYPIDLICQVVVGAIAAGNCVVIKPSEISYYTSALFAELIPQYMDNDCVRVVEGGPEETTELLKYKWDHIFYTGNGFVGKIVMKAAAEHLTPVTLELGGKSPVIVAKDADLSIVSKRVIFGKLMNCGQTCIAPDYVLVERGVDLEQLQVMLIKTIEEFFTSNPQQSEDYARIINSRHFDRIQKLLKDQNPVYGGNSDREDLYIHPTIVINPPLDSDLMKEEIFGPILPIIQVDSVDHAIDFVNSRERPLALYVFSRNPKVQQKVLRNTTSGGACINDTYVHVSMPDLPFGGVGPSGMGRYHGKYSFDTFSHSKSVVDSFTMMDPSMKYPPYPPHKVWLLEKAIHFNPGSLPQVILVSVSIPILYYIGRKNGFFGGPRL